MRIGNIIHVGERALPIYAPVIHADEPDTHAWTPVCASVTALSDNDPDGDTRAQQPVYQRAYGYRAVARFFGLTLYRAEKAFGPVSGRKQTPADMARALTPLLSLARERRII